RRSVALRPRSITDRLILASLLDRANQLPEARREYVEAARLSPHDFAAHREYAAWLLRNGKGDADLQRAETEAQRAATLAPADAASQLTLGRVLVRRGSPAAALAPLERAAGLEPNDPAPALALAETFRGLGRAPDAA